MNKTVILMAAMSMSLCACHHNEKTEKAPETVKVKTMVVTTTDITGSRVFSGTIEESKSTSVSFPIGGTLSTINVSEGQTVQKGQVIATIDATNLKNAYEIARTATAQAKDVYDRMKTLHDANSIPDMKWVEAQNALASAQSAEAIARRALSDATLTAPVSGYVQHRYLEPGQTVAPIAPVVTIVTLNPVKVNVSIPENEISSIDKGQRADITVGSIGGTSFSGAVSEKGIAANPITRAYDVKIQLPNPGNQLMPGMICDVVFESAAPTKAIVLPPAAVTLNTDNTNFVWVCQDGKAQRRTVKVEGMTDSGIIVSSGIADGDSVIIEGQQKVSDNTLVKSI